MLKEPRPAVYGLIAGLVYVCGFLNLNAYLARFGIVDSEFVDSEYLTVGATFVLFIVLFYCFPGRSAWNAPRTLLGEASRFKRVNADNFWKNIASVYLVSMLLFDTCLATALFASIALEGADERLFQVAMIGTFVVLILLDRTQFENNYPRIHAIVWILVRTLISVVFLSGVHSLIVVSILSFYLVMIAYVSLIADRLKRFVPTTDFLSYSAIYSVVAILMLSIAYGLLIYPSIKPSIGGPRTQLVTLILTKEASDAYSSLSASHGNKMIVGKLIHQTDRYIYMDVNGAIMTLRAADTVLIYRAEEVRASSH